jgi:hypothetical protein
MLQHDLRIVRRIVIEEWECSAHAGPWQIVICIPEITRKGVPMATANLLPTDVSKFRLELTKDGAVIPMPSDTTFSVISSDPVALEATIATMSTGVPAVQVRLLTATQPDTTITVSDNKGSQPATQVFSSSGVVPVGGTAISINLASVETTTQPAPV